MPTFNTPEPITAVLDLPAGRVKFIAVDQSDTTVEILPADASKSRDVKVAEETTVTYRDGVLQIAASAKNQYFGPSGSVEATVQLPTGSRIETTAASVAIRAVGRFGDVTVDSAHGAITLDEVASAHLTTSAGDVSIARLGGPAQIRTSKGDIRIAEAVRGMVVLRTDAGEVEVCAAAGVSASLDGGTSNGRIRNSLKSTDGAADHLTVHATTATGDIIARSL
ncbi:DUF4097 family beta strand repeat-containing protein [Streptomyces noursei]|uniref:DUF4097 family beta strand repeat-containing protein n=1 Tax=Streptomyces noursei TaxID=1971 RepID=UPI0005CB14B1|nr:DUF4097 family beta strand repeat-containing protein [Streptomyces noursei]